MKNVSKYYFIYCYSIILLVLGCSKSEEIIQSVDVSAWKSISCGKAHTLATRHDGTLWGWGSNENKQLGDSPMLQFIYPKQIGTENDWNYVVAGHLHSYAIKNDGSLWAWGYNANGELGIGNNQINQLVKNPTRVGTDSDWKQISTNGGDFTSLNSGHTLALKLDGSLWVWGYNNYGQLGNGKISSQNTPVKINSPSKWRKVSAGSDHSLGIAEDGSLWAWGKNESGQLGRGDFISTSVPKIVGIDKDWKDVFAGPSYSIALKNDGTLWSWGGSGYGVLGDSSVLTLRNYPKKINEDTDWKIVSCTGPFVMAIKNSGSLWAWGSNNLGLLGNGQMYGDRYVPMQIGSDSKWETVITGTFHTYAIKNDKSIWMWGSNSKGQLGDSTTFVKLNPTRFK